MSGEGGHRAPDLVGAGHEDEKITFGLSGDARALSGGDVPYRFGLKVGRLGQIFDGNGEAPPLRGEYLAGPEIIREPLCVESGRHHDNLQIGPRSRLDLQGPREGDVTVEVALVKLVKDQRRHAAQRSVERHLTEQNTLGHEAHPRLGRHARFEADLVAHFVAQHAADLLRHPSGQHARGESARLEHHDLAFFQEAVRPQHLGNLGGLARTGWRLHHDPSVRAQRRYKRVLKFINWQIAGGHRAESPTPQPSPPCAASPASPRPSLHGQPHGRRNVTD